MSDQIRAELAHLRNQMQFLETAQATLIERAERAEGYLSELEPRYKDIVTERGELRDQNAELLAGLKAIGDEARNGNSDQLTRRLIYQATDALIAKYGAPQC